MTQPANKSWTIIPTPAGNLDSRYPNGVVATPPSWGTIPNFLSETSALSVDVTQYFQGTPTSLSMLVQSGATGLSAAKGIYVNTPKLASTSNNLPVSVYQASYIDGVVIQAEWSQLEPSAGTFDWSVVDVEINNAVAYGKKLVICVDCGNYSPTWLYSAPYNVPNGTFLWGNHDCASGGTMTQVPVPWDSTYITRFTSMIAAFSSHLSGITGAYAAVNRVRLTGMNTITDELHLAFCSTMTSGLNGTTPFTGNGNQLWQALGYTPNNLIAGGKLLMAACNTAFPDKILSQSILQNGDLPLINNAGTIIPNTNDPTYIDATQALITYGIGAYPGRYAVQWNGFELASNASAKVLAAAASGAIIGWETNEHGGNTNGALCLVNGTEVVCTNATYQILLDQAISAGGQYVEIFQANMPLSTALAQAQGALNGGWAFVSPHLTYTPTLATSFTAKIRDTNGGVLTDSNVFTCSSGGVALTDTVAPTVPTGLTVSAGNPPILTFDPSSDPSPPGGAWSGMQDYRVYKNGSVLATVTTTAGLNFAMQAAVIGSPAVAGSASQTGAVVTMAAGGLQYFNTADEGEYYYGIINGDFFCSMIVNSFTSTWQFSKIMIDCRVSTAANSARVTPVLFPFSQGQGYVLEYRGAAGANVLQGSNGTTASGATTRWVALTRQGNVFTFYTSVDGLRYTAVDAITLAFPSQMLLGVACCAEQAATTASATCADFNVVAGSTPLMYTDNAFVATINNTYSVSARDTVPNESAQSAGVLINATGGTTATLASDLYPRTCGLCIGSPQSNYGSTAFQTWAGKRHITIYDPYLGVEGQMGMSLAQAQANARANGVTNGIVSRAAHYAIAQQLAKVYNNGGNQSPNQQLIAQVNAANWWLRTSWPGGAQITNSNGGGNDGIPNDSINSNVVTIGGTKYTWPQFYAAYHISLDMLGTAGSVSGTAKEAGGYAANPKLDAFFNDNQFWTPTQGGAWAQNTTNYNQGTAILATWLQQGHQQQIQGFRAIRPAVLQLGNWNGFNSANSQILACANLYDGVFCETAIGQSSSVEEWGGFGAMMTNLKTAEGAMATNGTLILHQDGVRSGQTFPANQSGWNSAQWQGARYGLGSALLRNWHFCLTNGTQTYAANVLFSLDEYDAGVGNLKYLGAAVDPPQSLPWNNGVWRRRFAGGTVYVNPKNNGTQSVTATGHNITHNGFSDTGLYTSGSAVTSFTLQDRDMRILLP